MTASTLPPIHTLSPRSAGPAALYYDPYSPSGYGSNSLIVNSHMEHRFTDGGLLDQGHPHSSHAHPHRHTTSPGRDTSRTAGSYGVSSINPGNMSMEEKRKAVLAASYNRQYTTEQLMEGVRHSSVPVGRKEKRRLHGISALIANTPCIVHPGANPVCALPSSPGASLPSAASLPKLPPSTLDGIGHPAPAGVTITRTIEPVFILNHKWGLEARRTLSPGPRKPLSDSQTHVNLSSVPVQSRKSGVSTVSGGGSGKQGGGGGGHQSPRGGMAAAGGARQSIMDGTAGAASVGVTGSGDSLRPAAPYEPLSDDPLQLWRGRRLNKVEVKIEQRLHVLRVNPVARIEFEMKVKDLHHEKAEEEAIAAAKAAEAETRKARMLEAFQARSSHHMVCRTDRSEPRRSRGHAGSRTGHAHGAAPPQNSALFAKGSAAASRFYLYAKAVGGSLEEQAALVIQKNWRAYLEHKHYQHTQHAVGVLQRMAHTRYAANSLKARRVEAAELILLFLAYADSECQGKIKAKVKHAQDVTASRDLKGLNLKQPVRVALLMRQWTAVEGWVQQLCQKRTRGLRKSNSGAAFSTPAAKDAAGSKGSAAATLLLKQSLAARKRGTMITTTDPEKGIDKLLTAEYAVSRCFVSDRVLSDTLESVPQDVKGAVISVYLAHKKDAYIALLGLHWKAAARWKMQKRQNDMLAAARSVVDTGKGTANTEVVGVGLRPQVPAYRMLATTGELRALMQQGVYEGALYKTYLLKGNLSEYEQKLVQELAARAPAPGRRGGKAVLQATTDGARTSMSGAGGPGTSTSSTAPPMRVSMSGNRPPPLVIAGGEDVDSEAALTAPAAISGQDASSGSVDGLSNGVASAMSAGVVATGKQVLTVAQQRQRWWQEAEARTNRCLRKRYAMLSVDLVECLLDPSHTQPEAMAVQLVNLQ